MKQLFGGNTHFRLKQKDKVRHFSVEEAKRVQQLSSPSFQGKIFQYSQADISKHETTSDIPSIIKNTRARGRTVHKAELGQFGSDYDKHLRKTVLSQTKTISLDKRRQSSWKEQSQQMASDQNIKSKSSKLDLQPKNVHQTLSILQKVISKQNDSMDDLNKVLELKSNKLPMIKKEKLNRMREYAAYDPYGEKVLSNIRNINNRDDNFGIRRRRKMAQQAELCGWIDNQLDQF